MDNVDEVQFDSPIGDGQADTDIAEPTEDLPILDVDQYGNYRVPVKVDGTEEFIPLEEARASYMRQADYTRKTQEIAQQRNELGWASAMKAALDQDPQGTIALLQQHYNVSQPAPQASRTADPIDDWLNQSDDGWGQKQQDPRVASLESRLARMEQQAHEAELKNTIMTLQSKYPDFNPTEVVAAAIRSNTTDLESVYKQIAFDKVLQTKSQLEQQVAQMEQQRRAKQNAAIVSGGSGVSSAGADKVGDVRSIADAWHAAKRQLSS